MRRIFGKYAVNILYLSEKMLFSCSHHSYISSYVIPVFPSSSLHLSCHSLCSLRHPREGGDLKLKFKIPACAGMTKCFFVIPETQRVIRNPFKNTRSRVKPGMTSLIFNPLSSISFHVLILLHNHVLIFFHVLIFLLYYS